MKLTVEYAAFSFDAGTVYSRKKCDCAHFFARYWITHFKEENLITRSHME